ncbi:MAG: hypothetical protein M1818_006938, partial [Claussenomyces sp. TS43310]
MLYQITRETEKGPIIDTQMLTDVLPLLNANMEAMRLMIPLFATAQRCAGAPGAPFISA